MAKEAHFEIFRKNLKYMPRVVFDEESKTGPGFEIGQQQQKCQRKLSLQLLTNPAVPSAVSSTSVSYASENHFRP